MALDINTLFMVTMHVEIMLGLLLFFAWAQNFSKTALAWWGSAHLLRAVSIMLFGLHGAVPDWVSLDLSNAVLFSSFAVMWNGARAFRQRPPELVWSMVGVAIWLLACRLPQFAGATEFRGLVGSGIVACYTWLTAYEFWRGRDEKLVSRWPAIFMLFAHGALFLLRTPLGAILQLPPTSDFAISGWIELLSVESLLFTISIAFILLAMAKERTELRHRTAAATDMLTGIANRRGFMERTSDSRRWALDGRPAAVMLIDLDRFKSINDSHGHAVGDRTLQLFAEIAAATVGQNGLVGRWGGDEFAAVVYDVGRDRAAAMAERMLGAFEKAAAEIEGRQVAATVSIGVVHSESGALDLAGLLVQADQALYRAKERGRNCVEIDPPATADPASSANVTPFRTRSAA